MTTSSSTEDNLVIQSNMQANDYTDNQSGEASSDGDRSSSRQVEQSTESPSLIVSNETSVTYGVDWSTNARPSSHCWFPLTCKDASIAQSCEYVSCTGQKSKNGSSMVQCGSCTLVIHSHHFNDLNRPCRPSFIDAKDSSSKSDEHFWSHVSVLSIPCAHCQQTSIVNTLFGSGFIPPPLEILDQVTSMITSISENFNPQMSDRSSNGVVCLWCSRGYHLSCWEGLSSDKKIKCDYGIFRNIIVHPQWLSRSNESSTGFKARVPSNSANNDCLYTPVIALINKRSGGQVGEKIYRELIQKLNPRQVFLLENNETISQALQIYSSLPNLHICVFGGDGTVGWILDRLAEAYPSGNNPPVSICPLGTGNDLSRVLSWGEQYDPKRLFQTLLQIPQAQTVSLDRWKVQLEQLDASAVVSSASQYCETGFPIDRIFQMLFNEPKFARETNRARYENYQKFPNTRFINYMSFGLDAAIALEFHDQRIRDPSKFSSPLKNKLMYLNESGKYFNDFARANIWDLSSYIRLICDGQDLTNSLQNCHTLIVLNIPGYAAGTNPWGNSENSINLFASLSNTGTCFGRQDFGDRKIEVIGLSTTHMAAIHVGFSGYRIAQCQQIRLELSSPITAQMDGEPFYLPTSVAINIDHAGQVLVSKN